MGFDQMTFGQGRGQYGARGIEGSYIGTEPRDGAFLRQEDVPTPRGKLDVILEDLVALNRRMSEANARTTKELVRIGGGWPECAVDPIGGPDSDGVISVIYRVIQSLGREVGVFEDSIQRLGEL